MPSSPNTVFRALLPLGAVAALTGCPNPQTYGTPRTLDPGKITHTVAVEAWNYGYEDAAGKKQSATVPVSPTYQMRVGVADSVDVGIRLPNLASLGADVKYNPIRGKQFDLAIMPGMQWFQSSVKVNDTESKTSVYYLHLPVLLGLNLGESATLVLSPGVTYTAASSTASTSGSSAAATTTGAWARFGIGLNWRVGRRFALHPEVTVMRNFGDQKTTMAFMGLGFNFGSMPNYADGASGMPAQR